MTTKKQVSLPSASLSTFPFLPFSRSIPSAFWDWHQGSIPPGAEGQAVPSTRCTAGCDALPVHWGHMNVVCSSSRERRLCTHFTCYAVRLEVEHIKADIKAAAILMVQESPAPTCRYAVVQTESRDRRVLIKFSSRHFLLKGNTACACKAPGWNEHTEAHFHLCYMLPMDISKRNSRVDSSSSNPHIRYSIK